MFCLYNKIFSSLEPWIFVFRYKMMIMFKVHSCPLALMEFLDDNSDIVNPEQCPVTVDVTSFKPQYN